MTKPKLRSRAKRTVVVALHLMLSAGVISSFFPEATPAAEQTVPTNSAASTASPALEEVVVTGTHIATSTFTTPTPVTVIDNSTIQALGLTSVADVVNLVPQNSNFTSSANVGLGNFNVGAAFANLRGLDPFFGTRTLTLVDSKRFVPTSAGGAVDLNVAPSIMISRVDVVTGGASAAYGSDAVAGVVNIILDSRFEGAKFQLDGGQTSYHDGGDLHAALELGKSFMGGRLHELVAAEYEDARAIGPCGSARPWCAQGWSQYTNSGYLTNGLPHYLIAPGGTSFEPYTGMLDSLAFGYLGQFNNAGTALEPFNPGKYGTGLPYTATLGGSGPTYYDSVNIRPPVIHYSLYSRTGFDLTDSTHATIDLSFAQRRSTNLQASSTTGAPANLIFPDNAFLPPATAAAMGPVPAFFFTNSGAQLPLIGSTENNVGRIVLGLNGDLPGNWKWDGYYQWGETGTRERLGNAEVEYLGIPAALGGPPAPAGVYDLLNWALNAVTNPANGQVQCAATIVGNPAYNPLAAGCVPLNLFGAHNATQAALAYAYRTLHQDSAFTQQVASASATGDIFSGFGAGPIKAAVGAEFRHSMASVTHDRAEQPWYEQYVLSYGEDYSGTIDVVEGFGEILAPLLKDRPLARRLDLDVAIRETRNKNDNSQTGESRSYNFPTWKFNVNYAPVDWLELRATRSRDTRAPSFYELWSQTVDTGGLFGTVTNPWKNGPGSPLFGVATDAARVVTGGYVAAVGLRPEQADTTTAGMVFTPTDKLEGLRFSADWYQIIIHNAIAEIGSTVGGGGTIVNACYNGSAYFCQFLQGTPDGTGGFSQITAVQNANLNLGSYTTRGVDFELDYRLGLERLGIPRSGTLDLRLLGTYQYAQIINPGAGLPVYNYAGQTGPVGSFGDFNTVPRWQGSAFLTYTNGPLTGVVQLRAIGSGKYGVVDSNTSLPLIGPGQAGYTTTYAGSVSNNSVASATYVNMTLSYSLPLWEQAIQVFGTLSNVFNRDPPVAPGGNGYPTNPVYFDTYGRTWKVGIRARF
jgi:outer membrane receptor protein involved in Fe transport